MLLGCAVAWFLMLRSSMAPNPRAGGVISMSRTMRAMPGMRYAMTASGGAARSSVVGSAGVVVLWWSLMTVAMMLPTTAPSIRYVCRMTPRRQRALAVALFCAAFVTTWLPGGLILICLHRLGPEPRWVGASAFLVAAVWELTPLKRRALLRCHRTAVIRAQQPELTRSCVAFGADRARWCITSCGPAMGALLLGAHTPILMGALAVILFGQKFIATGYRHPRWAASALALLACYPLLAG